MPPTRKIEKHFCRKCGTELDKECRFICYSSDNGKMLYNVKYVCPNHNRFLDGHDSFWHKSIFYDTVEKTLFYGDGTYAS